ncbi:hypothetical protein L6452_33618 [Arctium lappa]|uniref:Uncharacterized protein n=1 Tax=Arctium lappa TaxID=4217 RepID=A0ACB8YFY0_ARCLA|nr:hypothetical protein L6452_33618 [Arctium lappa]
MEGKQVMHESNEETEANGGVLQSKDGNSSQEEHKIIFQMRALVQKHDPTSKECDDATMRRFLRARDLDIDEASFMFLRYLRWRKMFLPNGSISESEVPNDIAQNKMFVQGTDKSGRPITVVFGGRHYPNKTGGLEEFKRFVVFGLEKICSRMTRGQEKFVSINDLQGWGYSNCDIHGYHASLLILQEYYPERLEKLFVVHAPYLFMAIWKLISPFIDEETKKKIVFVENKKVKSTLLKEIDESQLPEIYGGKLKLVPIQDS